jgi:hypothetical protein
MSTGTITVVVSLLEDVVCDRGQGPWIFILKVLERLIWLGTSSSKVLPITSDSFHIFAFAED